MAWHADDPGPVGLVGHTGFVGGNVLRQVRISSAYNRANLSELDGREFSTLWISAAPAEKWVANADPEGDAANLRALVDALRRARAEVVVLVSTVDVYPEPVGVDEATALAVGEHPAAYGRNRLALEESVRALFGRVLVARLPALFGPGLKKNLVFDLLHGREEFTHRESVFQFYDLGRLAGDVRRALDAGLDLVNLVTEPLVATEVAREVFGRELECVRGAPVRYDVQTRHADAVGTGAGPYLADRREVLEALRAFVAAQRSAA